MNHRQATRPTETSDERPIAASLAEDFARWQDELLGMLYYLVGNFEDARDALQETFLKCWRRREQWPEIENRRAWVFRIAMNTGRDLRATAWRRRRRPLEKEEAALPQGDQQPGAILERRERLDLVRGALADLRVEEQRVFLLRQNGEMTYEEIAQATNTPLGTVKTRMRLALRKLREALEEKPEKGTADEHG